MKRPVIIFDVCNNNVHHYGYRILTQSDTETVLEALTNPKKGSLAIVKKNKIKLDAVIMDCSETLSDVKCRLQLEDIEKNHISSVFYIQRTGEVYFSERVYANGLSKITHWEGKEIFV